MRDVLVASLIIALFGCTAEKSTDPLSDTSQFGERPCQRLERLRVHVPPSWEVVHGLGFPGRREIQYAPTGQQHTDWTESLWVQILWFDAVQAKDLEAQSVSSLDELFGLFRIRSKEVFVEDCAVSPIIGPETIFTENGFWTRTVQLACGRRVSSAHGWLENQKEILGTDAHYFIRRIWILPPASDSRDLATTPEISDLNLAHLELAGHCDNVSPRLRR